MCVYVKQGGKHRRTAVELMQLYESVGWSLVLQWPVENLGLRLVAGNSEVQGARIEDQPIDEPPLVAPGRLFHIGLSGRAAAQVARVSRHQALICDPSLAASN